MSQPVAKLPVPEGRKLASVTLVHAVSFGARTSFAVGTNCESVQPARLETDGDWVAIDKGQRADGLGVRVSVSHGTQRRIRRYFVPWANVADIGYDG